MENNPKNMESNLKYKQLLSLINPISNNVLYEYFFPIIFLFSFLSSRKKSDVALQVSRFLKKINFMDEGNEILSISEVHEYLATGDSVDSGRINDFAKPKICYKSQHKTMIINSLRWIIGNTPQIILFNLKND